MDGLSQVVAILRADPVRWHLLEVVRSLRLRDGWIGAGFVRNAVWDHLHGRPAAQPSGDIDVIWYDPTSHDAVRDREYEAALYAIVPTTAWSVKNQARMHLRNADPPYRSATDAMRYWPETATAVAVRRMDGDACEVAAPYGLQDLMHLVLRPTPYFVGDRRAVYEKRVAAKRWTDLWPTLRKAVD